METFTADIILPIPEALRRTNDKSRKGPAQLCVEIARDLLAVGKQLNDKQHKDEIRRERYRLARKALIRSYLDDIEQTVKSETGRNGVWKDSAGYYVKRFAGKFRDSLERFALTWEQVGEAAEAERELLIAAVDESVRKQLFAADRAGNLCDAFPLIFVPEQETQSSATSAGE